MARKLTAFSVSCFFFKTPVQIDLADLAYSPEQAGGGHATPKERLHRRRPASEGQAKNVSPDAYGDRNQPQRDRDEHSSLPGRAHTSFEAMQQHNHERKTEVQKESEKEQIEPTHATSYR